MSWLTGGMPKNLKKLAAGNPFDFGIHQINEKVLDNPLDPLGLLFPEKQKDPSKFLAQLALQQFQRTAPLRTPFIESSTDFLKTGDVSKTLGYAGMNDAINNQYQGANTNLESTFGNMPGAEAASSNLATEQARARDVMRGNLAAKEMDRSYNLGLSGPQVSSKMLQSYAGIQGGLLRQQQQQQAQAKQGLGQGLGYAFSNTGGG